MTPNVPKQWAISVLPLFQSESKWETILLKMTLLCMKMILQAELIFISKVSHLDSFLNWDTRELRNGLWGRKNKYREESWKYDAAEYLMDFECVQTLSLLQISKQRHDHELHELLMSLRECYSNRPFAGSGHMVRNKLYWDANNAVRLSKQRKVRLEVPLPLRYLRPGIIYSVPRDRIVQRAYSRELFRGWGGWVHGHQCFGTLITYRIIMKLFCSVSWLLAVSFFSFGNCKHKKAIRSLMLFK